MLNLLELGTTRLIELSVAALFAWYIISALASWYRLRHVPGPFLASFSSLWMAKSLFMGSSKTALQNLRKYGRLVRSGPNYLVTDDPDILRQIAAVRGTYTRDDWWSVNKMFDHHSLVTHQQIAPHDSLKAKLAFGYSGRDVELEKGIDTQIAHLKDVIRRRYLTIGDQTRPVDFAQLAYYFTLDVISHIAYGKEFGWLDAEGDFHGYTNLLDGLFRTMSIFAEIHWMRCWFNTPPLSWLKPKHTDKAGFGKILSIAREITFDRFDKEKPEKHHGDMLGSFMRHGVGRDECDAEAAVIFIAGSETSATAIRSTMLFLMSTPRAYGLLKEEIKQAIQRGEVSSPITVEEAKKLPYLQAVISEGFRMRPPVIFGHYKTVPPGGDTINGMFIPGGTAIGHNSIAMMRSESIFGQDVDVFRPERFLECSEDQKLNMDRTLDLHFGYGRWMCAGKPVAQMELNKIYFELLRSFDFQLINVAKAWTEETFVTWRQKDLMVRITEAS